MQKSKAILIPLVTGFIVQIATAWNSLFYNSDEYFQIIASAGQRFGILPATNTTWEFEEKIRSTIQIHFFTWFYKCFEAIGVTDRFLILSLLHVLIGTTFFIVSNYLIYDKFKSHKFLPQLFWLNNFFWIIPFLRCRFSAEVMGAFFWIAGIILFEKFLNKERNFKNYFFLFVSGVVFAISFFCRFQILFALLGLACWFLIQHRNKWQEAGVVITGFLAGSAINIVLDKVYYGQWVLTPYRYFQVNILEGKADSFGTSPWWYYIVVLIAVAIPLAGLFLISFFARGLTLYKNPFALGSLFFIAGHSIVGHKEERFMFPVILVMVYLAAEAYVQFPSAVQRAKAAWNSSSWRKPIRAVCYFFVALNGILVLLLCVETYKQPVLFIRHFNSQLKNNDQVISFKQHPYQTESGLPYTFLSQNKYDSCIRVIDTKERFIAALEQHPDFKYCILLADARKNNLEYLLEDKHAIVASSFIYKAGKYLATKFNIVIPDLWICQTYSEVVKVRAAK